MSWEITLLTLITFLAETLYHLDKRSPSKCKISDFWLHSHEISPYLYFDRHLLLKVYTFSAKKVQRSYVSWHWRMKQKLKKNWFFVSKMTRIWWILTKALEYLKHLHFDWFLLCKVYSGWPKKVQRNYLTWHWGVMQNLKKNWIVVWKMRNLANFQQSTWKC